MTTKEAFTLFLRRMRHGSSATIDRVLIARGLDGWNVWEGNAILAADTEGRIYHTADEASEILAQYIETGQA